MTFPPFTRTRQRFFPEFKFCDCLPNFLSCSSFVSANKHSCDFLWLHLQSCLQTAEASSRRTHPAVSNFDNETRDESCPYCGHCGGAVFPSSFVPLLLILCLHFLSESVDITKRQLNFAYMAASLNACCNPLIYCWRRQRFKEAFARLLKCKKNH